MPLKIVFMGTPQFSIPALQALINGKFNIISVYTQPPKKSKRGQKINFSPIELFSKKKKINVRHPSSLDSDEELKVFKELSPDLAIVVAYGQIIPSKFLATTKLGFINIHGSLLPKWRGAAPIQRAIINGDKKIGISIMKIVEKLDRGPVLSSKAIELNKEKTYGEIEKELSVMGADLLIESLENLKKGKVNFLEQVHSEATYAKKINKEETKIKWNLDPDKVISHIHGLSPNPGAWFEYENERYKVLRAKKSLMSGNPGTIIDENLVIACQSKSVQILELQRQGKNIQSTKEFLLGKKIKKGSVLN